MNRTKAEPTVYILPLTVYIGAPSSVVPHLNLRNKIRAFCLELRKFFASSSSSLNGSRMTHSPDTSRFVVLSYPSSVTVSSSLWLIDAFVSSQNHCIFRPVCSSVPIKDTIFARSLVVSVGLSSTRPNFV